MLSVDSCQCAYFMLPIVRNLLYFSAVLMATWAIWFHCETCDQQELNFLSCVLEVVGTLVSCARVLLLSIFSD